MTLLAREKLEERLAALHRASLELVSDLSRNNVLERIAHLAREQAEARYAAIGIINAEGELEKFIPIGMSDEEIARIDHPPRGLGLIGAIHKEKRAIRLPEISTDPRSAGFPPHHPPMHSFLGVPIMSAGKLLGQIYLTDKVNAPEFTEEDERVIEILAAYAAVAIENSRLYESVVSRDQTLTQQYTDLALLYQLAHSAAQAADMETQIQETLPPVTQHFAFAASAIYVREDENDRFNLSMHAGEAGALFAEFNRFQLDEGFFGEAARGDYPKECNVTEINAPELRDRLQQAGLERIACTPLRASNRVVGLLVAARKSTLPLSRREEDLLGTISTLAGTAIESIRLKEHSRRIAILEERERIGMDLHDGVIQSIYSVGLALDYARLVLEEDPKAARQKISEAIDGLNSTIQDIRAYILDLRPRQLRGGETLTRGLQRLLDEFRRNVKAKTRLATSEDGFLDLPRRNALAIFHICQESLANAAKHAQANLVEVQLWATDDRVYLKVSDDGCGFELDKTTAAIGHGLSNMERRVRKVGGEVNITSQPNQGTTVIAWVPRNSTEKQNSA